LIDSAATQVLSVDYPHVMVSRASFVPSPPAHIPPGDTYASAGVLSFTLNPGDNAPTNAHTVTVGLGGSCSEIETEVTVAVYLMEVMYSDWSYECDPRGRPTLSIFSPGWGEDYKPRIDFLVTISME
jgi:hypothetical protein